MEDQYLETSKTLVWKYILGIGVIILGCFLFSIPFNLALVTKIDDGIIDATRVEDFSYLGSVLGSNLFLFYMMMPFVGGLVFLFLVVKKLHKQSITSLTTTRQKIDFKRIFFSFTLWLSVIVLLFVVGYFIDDSNVVWNFEFEKFIILFLIAIIMIPIQTSFEEYVFRGYLMQGLTISSQTKWIPLLLTSVVFGLLHYANPEVQQLGYVVMVFYIGTGLLLGVITLMDGGVELSLGFHAANNLVTALLVTTDWTAMQTPALFKDFSEPSIVTELLAMAVFYPLLLFVFSRKYKWKNWKEKLI